MSDSSSSRINGFIATAFYVIVSGLMLKMSFAKTGHWGAESYLLFYALYGPTVVAVFWLFSRRTRQAGVVNEGDSTADPLAPRHLQNFVQSKAKRQADRALRATAVFLISAIGATAVGLVGVFVFDVHPLDRIGIVFGYGFIGCIAGGAVALVVLLSAVFEV